MSEMRLPNRIPWTLYTESPPASRMRMGLLLLDLIALRIHDFARDMDGPVEEG